MYLFSYCTLKIAKSNMNRFFRDEQNRFFFINLKNSWKNSNTSLNKIANPLPCLLQCRQYNTLRKLRQKMSWLSYCVMLQPLIGMLVFNIIVVIKEGLNQFLIFNMFSEQLMNRNENF
ncbi:hypothetical protein BpHYR1_036796 [Brachionus plicatilis]|uniref:Uncharacterized protein n=1 Tax=Brachionus plicatilis TaxID=10195 RepID=A0A3M7RYD3_BRAPC|nr:hypothetical protein BpHYR1_036796 [Brachionus plicatilis]